jgi:UDP-N-acetylglucosamine 2-epimerase (non-hydrolysing)
VKAGIARLVGTDPERIITGVKAILSERELEEKRLVQNPYGDGNASDRILKALKGETYEPFKDGQMGGQLETMAESILL